MNIFFIILALLVAGTVAFLLNILLANRIEKRSQRLALQIVTSIVCFLLSIVFMVFGILKITLNNFLDGKISYYENELNKILPNSNIMEKSIDSTELVLTINELQKIMDFDKTKYDFLETLILNTLFGKTKDYINLAENQVSKLSDAADENGIITIKSMLLYFKEQSLNVILPYFRIAQYLTVVLLFLYIIIYISIVIFLKKGGGSYNKSIVFGEDAEKVERGMDDRQI